MRIETIRIENYRSFEDETIELNRYTCLVGANGAGKSTVLAALNIFFQEKTSAPTDVSRLVDEDYFQKNTSEPVRVTLAFEDLPDAATSVLADYVRRGNLVVTAEAAFDPNTGIGTVRHYGQRLGMQAFRVYFDLKKRGVKVKELREVYSDLRADHPDLPQAATLADMEEGLRAYERERPDQCVQIPSEDNFYGVNGTGMLADFVQWVYVPAVKDVVEEGTEAKNTALGKLILRAVRARTNFEEELETLRQDTLAQYKELLDQNKQGLDELSTSLQQRLETWAHGNARLEMDWQFDQGRSVVLQQPVAGLKTGESGFVGSLARMGHGLQRSYLLALLQELAAAESDGAPTLILGVEEPELYQHPPQARHLSDVLLSLCEGNAQTIVTTHSPLFVSGRGFENTRAVRAPTASSGSKVKAVRLESLVERIRSARQHDQGRPIEGQVAKIHQALQPGLSEMLFASVPVLVEGLEDVSYIVTHLHVTNQWGTFRRLGCHLIPVNGKSRLVQPIAIAAELEVPIFTVFDADGDEERHERLSQHARDNQAILRALGVEQDPFPSASVVGRHFALWPANLGVTVKDDFGDEYKRLTDGARQAYSHEGGLEKNDLFIADWLSSAFGEGLRSDTLDALCSAIVEHAESC